MLSTMRLHVVATDQSEKKASYITHNDWPVAKSQWLRLAEKAA